MKLYAWGANNYGQLGLGYTSEQCNHPVEILRNEPLRDSIKYLTGGGGHTLIMDNNGQVYGCGLNSSGQLGLSDGYNRLQLKRIECLDKYQVAKISCGWDSSFAVTKDEHALVWGSNIYSQLGLSKDVVKKAENPCYLPVSGVVQISSGLRHTAILLDSGKMLISGQGKKGQLGLVRSNQPLTETDSFLEVPYLENIKMVACGQHHTIALTRDGYVLAWGDNKHGQLGCDPSSRPCVYTPMLIESVGQSHKVVSIQAGWTHSVLHADDNLIINFGRNSYGQLGSPVERRPATWIPEFISLSQGIRHFAVGSEHNCLITDDGEVWSWGWNEHGNCGLGSDVNVFTPTRIDFPMKAVLIGSGSAHSFALIE